MKVKQVCVSGLFFYFIVCYLGIGYFQTFTNQMDNALKVQHSGVSVQKTRAEAFRIVFFQVME